MRVAMIIKINSQQKKKNQQLCNQERETYEIFFLF